MAADIILNQTDTEIVENVRCTREPGRAPSILLDSENGNIVLGGDGRDGDLILNNRSGGATILLSGDSANVNMGGNGQDGDLVLKDGSGNLTIHLNGSGGNLHLGRNGQDGDIMLYDADGHVVMHLNGSGGNLHLGARNREGDLFVYDNNGQASIHLNGQNGKLYLGHRGNGGSFQVVNDDGDRVITGEKTGRLTCRGLEADGITLPVVGDLATKIADLESGSPSDERMKENIRPLEGAQTIVDKLAPVRFHWKTESGGEPRNEKVGFVAQQVETVFPEAVNEDSQGTLRVDYDAVVAALG